MTPPLPPQRDRRVLVLLTGAIIALGLASRHFAAVLPHVISAYAGDTLYATMLYCMIACVVPRSRDTTLATIALALSVLIECSQRYHAHWIDAIRSTHLGALVLGVGFLWSDLVCYTVGVALAFAVDRTLTRRPWH